MFKFFSTVPDTAQADALFAEAYACLEQGLCYDEVDDYVSFIVYSLLKIFNRPNFMGICKF